MAEPYRLCESPTNMAQFYGKVIVATRGDCSFDTKSAYASASGAKAIVILSKYFVWIVPI